jgi:hypothetical protein
LGACCYGLSNVLEEFLVSKRPLYEVVGQVPCPRVFLIVARFLRNVYHGCTVCHLWTRIHSAHCMERCNCWISRRLYSHFVHSLLSCPHPFSNEFRHVLQSQSSHIWYVSLKTLLIQISGVLSSALDCSASMFTNCTLLHLWWSSSVHP